MPHRFRVDNTTYNNIVVFNTYFFSFRVIPLRRIIRWFVMQNIQTGGAWVLIVAGLCFVFLFTRGCVIASLGEFLARMTAVGDSRPPSRTVPHLRRF
ncbi:uncharacterized protein BCR38DRAFT_187665 [Pseudomassariella vexata]|uniref:Uncharacterized protein n=1 Tax=Pseudomassariella vexata TaxID=1141098 RepID=A0A1Y2E069_9PEZI|nr:uncharacterized protein BCR38DRAFT_187665 [Pseudomassariella vexata]ORY64940.1 hypothetical protein BCR38DRAFT_187665 [Pseudomassariella vexata]